MCVHNTTHATKGLDRLHTAWTMRRMVSQINSAEELIDLFGGNAAVAKLFGTTHKAVHNWRSRGLPPTTYVGFQRLLTNKGLEAPMRLWRQRPVELVWPNRELVEEHPSPTDEGSE